MTKRPCVWIFLAVLCFGMSLAQDPESLRSNPCLLKESCRQCIMAAPNCAWCASEVYSNSRCDLVDNLKKACNAKDVLHPKTVETVTNNEDFSDKSAPGRTVQLKPQRVQLKMKPNSPHQLKVDFRLAADSPVDLYVLMDLSLSMLDDKVQVAALGNLLSERMGNITSDFRLGFGSFVDKVAMPYVLVAPKKLQEPCRNCTAPYGFRNQMPLSLNTADFAKEVAHTPISGNLDTPEGGLDAIMQVVVCKNDVKWRDASRKLLVFATDAGFHYAGDGKLGGIVKPNDGMCHLDTKGYYTESLHQDYPSLGQIKHVIEENKVHVIFAVTASEFSMYKQLSDLLQGSSTAQLESDSSNIVHLIKEEYEKITKTVKLIDDAQSNVKVSYYSACLDGRKEPRDVCNDLKTGSTVSFEVHVEVLSCPKERHEWKREIRISPGGLNESLIIDLEMICECDCGKPGNAEPNSSKCSGGNGTYECGVCNCNTNRYGRHCECDSKESDQSKADTACYNVNDTSPCSSRGRCKCGVCDCDTPSLAGERIWGTFCECDNCSCDHYGGKVCNGENGECSCGVCICNKGWKGNACGCRDTNDTCISNNGRICNGHGECECGQCVCRNTQDERYSGRFCEFCDVCPDRCSMYTDCVLCQVFGTGPLSKEDCSKCSFVPTQMDVIEVTDAQEKLCVDKDETDGCKFTFKYKVNSEDIPVVYVQKTKDCPEGVNILAVVLGVVGAVVLAGLIGLAAWKLITVIHDRREYAKFEEEKKNAKWTKADNPIYKEAVSNFKNPTFGNQNWDT